MSGSGPGTQRIGGGRSARGAALVAALTLVVVVGIAVAGRAPQETAAPPTAPALGAVTPRPTASLTSRGPVPTPGAATPAAPATWPPFVLPTPRPGPAGNLAVIVVVGPRASLAFLSEDPHGTLAAVIRMPFPRAARDATLELGEVRDVEGEAEFSSISTFRVELAPLVPETTQSGIVLDRRIEPHPELEGVPELIRTGYALRILAESQLDEYVLFITVNGGQQAAAAPLPSHSSRR